MIHFGKTIGKVIQASTSAIKTSVEWFRSTIETLFSGTPEKETKQQNYLTQEEIVARGIEAGIFKAKEGIEIGKMYLFHYDPKYKKILPFYDEFPLVFPFGFFKGGFIGLNIHYIPYTARLSILGSLSELASDTKYTEETKLKLSYRVLQTSSIMFKTWYKDCIKKYLYDHVHSAFNIVDSKDWDKAAALPTERWVYSNGKIPKYRKPPRIKHL
jgi:hypothetical protein